MSVWCCFHNWDTLVQPTQKAAAESSYLWFMKSKLEKSVNHYKEQNWKDYTFLCCSPVCLSFHFVGFFDFFSL